MKLTKETSAEDIYLRYFFSKEDTVSAIFNALGWFHTRKWTEKEDAIGIAIKELTSEGLIAIRKGKKSAEISTGGLRVELWLEGDDEINAQLSIEL